MPDPTSDAWSALNAGLTLLGIFVTGTVAYLAYQISRQVLLTEESPIILLERVHGHAQLSNVGKGTAVATYIIGPDRDDVVDGGIVAPGKAQPISDYRAVALDFKGHRSNELFYQSLSGRWWHVVATAAVQVGNVPENVTCAHRMQQIHYRWSVPRQVKKKIRTRARSIEAHVEALSSPITRDGLALRLTNSWKRTRMRFGKIVTGIGEPARVRRLQRLALADPPTADATEREGWELQVSGPFYCWHTSGSTIRQYSCRSVDDCIVCDIGLDRLSGGLVRGILVVSREAYERAGLDRHTRSETIFKRLNEYLCKRSPREFFACEIT